MKKSNIYHTMIPSATTLCRTTSVFRYTAPFIALVWFINGFFFKIGNLVPRHLAIVDRIVGHGLILTPLIGFAEICLSFWILSQKFSKLNVIVQIVLVLLMNMIEQIYTVELLLWGRANFIFALFFCVLIYFNWKYAPQNNSSCST